jgi:hypothetical protein
MHVAKLDAWQAAHCPANAAGNSGMHADNSTVGEDSSSVISDYVPQEFRCPISGGVMRRPVVAADGYTYERVRFRVHEARTTSSRRKASHRGSLAIAPWSAGLGLRRFNTTQLSPLRT